MDSILYLSGLSLGRSPDEGVGWSGGWLILCTDNVTDCRWQWERRRNFSSAVIIVRKFYLLWFPFTGGIKAPCCNETTTTSSWLVGGWQVVSCRQRQWWILLWPVINNILNFAHHSVFVATIKEGTSSSYNNRHQIIISELLFAWLNRPKLRSARTFGRRRRRVINVIMGT